MANLKNVSLSFVIPAYNEENNIGDLIRTINASVKNIQYEIIVVDNLSTDKTVIIAKGLDAKVYSIDGSIGFLRNFGASKAVGNVLIFLDADMEITNQWGNSIEDIYCQLSYRNCLITGSIADIFDENNWIEKNWFKPKVLEKNLNYMNSGHMIITRDQFQIVGGFDTSRVTGEDYEFCQRAKSLGCIIQNNPSLRVIHKGYPKNILDFFKREMWHGKGDSLNIKTTFSSKPALLSCIMLFGGMASIILSFFLSNFRLLYIPITFCTIISCISSYKKSNRINMQFLINSFLYLIYFFARGLSIVGTLIYRNKQYSNINRKTYGRRIG